MMPPSQQWAKLAVGERFQKMAELAARYQGQADRTTGELCRRLAETERRILAKQAPMRQANRRRGPV